MSVIIEIVNRCGRAPVRALPQRGAARPWPARARRRGPRLLLPPALGQLPPRRRLLRRPRRPRCGARARGARLAARGGGARRAARGRGRGPRGVARRLAAPRALAEPTAAARALALAERGPARRRAAAPRGGVALGGAPRQGLPPAGLPPLPRGRVPLRPVRARPQRGRPAGRGPDAGRRVCFHAIFGDCRFGARCHDAHVEGGAPRGARRRLRARSGPKGAAYVFLM
jgi:hypothetical protein